MSKLDLQLVDEKEIKNVTGVVEDAPMEPEVKELTKDLDKSVSSQIVSAYAPLELELKEFDVRYAEIEKEAKESGEDVSDDLSKRAKRLRLDIRPIRTGADALRKKQKENVNTLGKAIDGLGNFFKLKVSEKEQFLEKIEKAGEIKEQAKRDKLKKERLEILNEYDVDGSDLNLDVMPDEVWAPFLETKKKNFEDAKQAEIDAEKIRLEAEAKKQLGEDRKTKVLKLVNFIEGYDDILFSEITEEEFTTIQSTAEDKKQIEDKRVADLELENEKSRLAEVAKQEAEKKQSARKNKMFDLGLIFDGESFVYEDINFHHTDLLCMTDEKFAIAYKGAVERKKVLVKEKAEADKIENEKLAKIQNDRIEAERVKNLGIDRKSKLLDIEVKLDLESCTNMSNEEWTTFYTKRKDSYDKKIRLAKEESDRVEQARKDKEEADKKALLAPDKTKVEALMKQFEPLRGNLTTQEAKDAVTAAYTILKNAVAGMNS